MAVHRRRRIPQEMAGLVTEFDEAKGLSERLRDIINFAFFPATKKELSNNVFVCFRSMENMTFDEFIAPLYRSGSTHNIYGSLKNALTVKGRLAFGDGRTLWAFVPGGRMTAPTEAEYIRDQQKIIHALQEAGINCQWLMP